MDADYGVAFVTVEAALELLRRLPAEPGAKILLGIRKKRAREEDADAAAARAAPLLRAPSPPPAVVDPITHGARGRLLEHLDLALPEVQRLLKRGYCIIRGVVTPEELADGLDLFWEDSEALGTGIKRDDPSTHVNKAWPVSAHGLAQLAGWGLFPSACYFRLLTEAAWKKLYKGSQPVGSFDCMSICPGKFQDNIYPGCFDKEHLPDVQMPKWLHLDQANRKPEVLRHLQGALAVTRLGQAEQRTVLVIPKSGEAIQAFRDRYLAAFPTDPNEGKALDAERGEWLKHTAEQKRWLIANGRVVAPKLEAGDMLIWSSGVSHASAPGPLPPDQTERGMRITSFVSAVPIEVCSDAELKKRREILELGRTSGHRVLEPSLKITKDAQGNAVYHESTTRFRQCVFDKKGRVYPGGGDDELPEYNTDRVLSGFAEPGDCPLKQGMLRFCGGW